MCIVAISWQVMDELPLLLLSNRDEFYARPTQALHYWAEDDIFAGKDLQQSGTWLGTTKNGRWAVITNFREIDKKDYPTSRGDLVKNYLTSSLSPMQYAKQLQSIQQNYAGFNLIIGDQKQAVYLSNRGEQPVALANGVYILSNGLLSSVWHKSEHLRKRLAQELLPVAQCMQHCPDELMSNIYPIAMDILQDNRQLADELLPDTGVGYAWEKQLSSTFIATENYGTRCSNIIAINNKHLTWYEVTQYGEQQGDIATIDYDIVMKTNMILV
ncbi:MULTISPECIES: NRDE family protein [unclassified Acinetobacter]|uniref:NRDE family protein n=1 Tax=unclassified Acinetobacter TaxID=196816 RepID=UPI0035B97B1A